VSDYLVSNLQDQIGRLDGVGDMNVFGSQYAMRIWLDPGKLVSFGLMPGDVITAIQGAKTRKLRPASSARNRPRRPRC